VEYPNTRKEAKAAGAKYYFTGEPCKHGHVALRKTKGTCVECLKIEWRTSNAARALLPKSEAAKEAGRRYYERNKEQVIARAATRPKELLKAYRGVWAKNNKMQVNASNKARRRKHRDATPKWLSRTYKMEIRQIYHIAMTMTQTTGEQYVVDHIVPLRNPTVCGLHVPWNLRVITQEENLKKSNKHQ
jgi:5-methylcytosine-specific restriction endonuclease McrA